ncbi:MAG: amidase [Bdellovibrio sp. CG10_big_fil_rev_8_21_14_0_10_47_8]|nr:MAG: amidase [Bdellovibrio sp. CG10_big_fil_rev_8_21_14_0_10_47_8]
MEIYLMTWPEVESYLKNKKHLILPVGSTEQHGPTGLIGTDFLTAWDLAKAVGKKTSTLVASPLCYGMALHHMAFPGSGALKPSTYIQVVKEIIQGYADQGFRHFSLINGHGGNIPSLQAAFSEILSSNQDYTLQLFNWWHLSSVTDYEQKNFGDANGFHATCGEISVTMTCYPQAYEKKKTFEFFPTVKKTAWPLSPGQFRKTFPDGRMGSDPRLASAQHGQVIFERAVDEISQRLMET